MDDMTDEQRQTTDDASADADVAVSPSGEVETTAPDDASADADIADPPVTQPLEMRPEQRSSGKPFLIAAAAIALVLIAISQVFLITSLNDTQDQIESLDEQITELDGSLYDMSEAVDGIAEDAQAAAANNAASGATPAPAVPTGFLPRFTEGAQDQALGMTLTTIEGPDAYTESPVTIDPTDGTKRVWMVWAHWCPYCQQELPELNTWWPGAEDTFPNAELVTVTTSMDDSRGNPLEPYLEESQFAFPVVVDGNSKIAAQMGVNAFPFWLVTDGDGTVLFRTAGALHIDQVEQLFNQLEEIDA